MTLERDIHSALQSADIDHETGAFSADLEFPGTQAFFAGHFPGRPLLPAFMHIELVRQVAQSLAGGHLTITCVTHAKFMAQITPDQQIHVQGQITGRDPCLVKANLSTSAGLAARVQFHAKRACSSFAGAHPIGH